MPQISSQVAMDRPVRDFVRQRAVTLRHDWTVEEALRHLRAGPPDTSVLYFYVVDLAQKLVGVVQARKLLLSPATARMDTLTERTLIVVRETDTLFDACELFAMHRLLAIPVVDSDGRFKGIVDVSVYTDEVFDLAEKRAANELFQLIGVHLEQLRHATPWSAYRLRMPWLLANIGGGLACALLGAMYDAVLQQVLIVALFIPIMLTLSESVAIQSMTLAVQRVAGSRRMPSQLARELLIALLLGCTSGLIVMAVAYAWHGPRSAPLVIGSAIVANMMLSAALGTIVPRLLATFKLDPSVAAGPVVLALADTGSVALYLSLATVVLVG